MSHCSAQQLGDLAVAVASVLPSKLDDVGAEPLLVVSTTRDLALRRAMLASRLRGSWDLAYARLGHPAQDRSHGSDQDDQGDKADAAITTKPNQ